VRNDQNINPLKAADMVGEKYTTKIEEVAPKLYTAARDCAYQRGIINAVTRFEFGLDEITG